MQRDMDKVWTTMLQFFTGLYAQRKAYGNNRAANSGFDSAALVQEYHHCQHNQQHHIVRPLHQES